MASLTPSTFSDHSYHRIVCVPYAPYASLAWRRYSPARSYEPRIRWICASVSNTAPVVSWNWTGLRTSSVRVRICLGALEIAKLHEDLSERRERDGEAVAGCRATGGARRCARRAPAPDRADGASARRSPGCARCRPARRRPGWPSPAVRPGAARPSLRRSGPTARAAPPTASARARGGGDRRPRAARTPLRSGDRGRCPMSPTCL